VQDGITVFTAIGSFVTIAMFGVSAFLGLLVVNIRSELHKLLQPWTQMLRFPGTG
jgi:hypothetical protein